MPTDAPISELWQRVDAAGLGRPTWRNSPGLADFRSYGSGGATLHIDGMVLRVSVRSIRKGLAIFACFFLPVFAAASWLMISEPTMRVAFTVAGPIVGMFGFAMIYGLERYHERLGDYLVIDQAAETVSLPREKKEFTYAQIISFQWIRGGTRYDWGAEVDLNLLVSEAGEVVRYHVLGNPSRRMIEHVLRFSGLSLQEIRLPWRGCRDFDKESVRV